MSERQCWRICCLWLTLCGCFGSVSVLADDGPNYSYVGAAYVWYDLDIGPISVDGDGPSLGFSAALSDSFRILGGYTQADFDFGIDVSGWNVGVGYIQEITPTMDFLGSLSLVRSEAEVAGFNSSADGYIASIGLQGMASPILEIGASIDYVDVDGESDTSVSGELLYFLTDTVSAGIAIDIASDETAFGLALRIDLGK